MHERALLKESQSQMARNLVHLSKLDATMARNLVQLSKLDAIFEVAQFLLCLIVFLC